MALQGEMRLVIWDVEHGACAMLQHVNGTYGGKLAMIDSGCTNQWHPSTYIKHDLQRIAQGMNGVSSVAFSN
ncbi:MAG: hypothetical protein WD795_18995 [Woeseia sp.]